MKEPASYAPWLLSPRRCIAAVIVAFRKRRITVVRARRDLNLFLKALAQCDERMAGGAALRFQYRLKHSHNRDIPNNNRKVTI